ncbi:hypothetical protein RFI_12716 [Reticulomyxa filosa]|uniref:RGS domain-containing protein n=1 Tax=Reticulomyxa filosa TaxID=46433 RepID=X6NEW9_RETFI|nr:hypothetical protein RFI_12716 [Reticulomyxa filosa]|eukprot:ETO24438.1 hypothetical protein RFI_12716 [Reticulomyxa filosa]
MIVTARVLYQNRAYVTRPKCTAETFAECWGPKEYDNEQVEKETEKQNAKLSTQIHLFASSKASIKSASESEGTDNTDTNVSGKKRVKSVSVFQEDANQLAAIDVEVGAHLLRQRIQTETTIEHAGNHNTAEVKKSKNPELRDVLADKVGFNLFMEHLFAGSQKIKNIKITPPSFSSFLVSSPLLYVQLSPETLLAYLEMCQFHYKNCSRTEKECTFHQKFPLSESLPRSAIVDSDAPVTEQIAGLVEKYLRESASYEVNVGHNVRMACIQKCKPEAIANKTKEELYNLFDPVVFALYRLMNSDSFQRFVYTESFRRYTDKYAA